MEAKYSGKLRTHIYHKHEAERANQKWIKAMIKHCLDHILPRARSYPPTLPKQHLQIGTKCWDAWANGAGGHSRTDHATLCIGVMFSLARELLDLCKELLAPLHWIQLSVCLCTLDGYFCHLSSFLLSGSLSPVQCWVTLRPALWTKRL